MAAGGSGGMMQGLGFGLLSGKSGMDLWNSTWKGGVAGALGGGVGGAVGHGILGAMAGGFSSGAVGTALNGGDFGDVMLGGLSGAGAAAAGYLAIWE